MSDKLNSNFNDKIKEKNKSNNAQINKESIIIEHIMSSILNEQKSQRKWKFFNRLVFLAILLVFTWNIFEISDHGISNSIRHTALISCRGEISSDKNNNAKNIISSLNKAFKNRNVAGIILQINSPGGSPVQSSLIYKEISRLRKKYPNTHIYAVAEDICASGGYYIASAAEKIYVDQSSIIGSIGVIMSQFGLTDFIKKIGIERRVQVSGKNKIFYDPFLPDNPKMKEHAKIILEQIHMQFIDAVQIGRKKLLNHKKTDDIFSGLFWTGLKSIELGLADELGDINYVAREVIKSPNIVDYTIKENLANRISQKLGESIGNYFMKEIKSNIS